MLRLWKKNAEKVEYNISKLIKHPCTTKSVMDVNRMCWDRTLYGYTCIWKTTLQTDQRTFNILILTLSQIIMYL